MTEVSEEVTSQSICEAIPEISITVSKEKLNREDFVGGKCISGGTMGNSEKTNVNDVISGDLSNVDNESLEIAKEMNRPGHPPLTLAQRHGVWESKEAYHAYLTTIKTNNKRI